MRFATDLGARERGIYRASFDDGLLDLFCGLTLVLMGVAWIFDIVVLGPLAPAVLIPFWTVARRRLIEPRTGFARFRPERERLEKRKLLGFFAIGCGFLIAGIAVYLMVRGEGAPDWGHLVAGLPGVLLAVAATIAGLAFGLTRFLAYALVLFAAGAVTIHWRLDPGWSILAGGSAMLVVGAVLLAGFLNRHPVVAEDG
jgi:hypothetical protein